MTDTNKELAELVERAMQQPGVAEVMTIYEAARTTSVAAQESMQPLQPQWFYQASNTSS